jgi:hypothetical protein
MKKREVERYNAAGRAIYCSQSCERRGRQRDVTRQAFAEAKGMQDGPDIPIWPVRWPPKAPLIAAALSAILAALVVFVGVTIAATPSLGGECPPAKRLTCAQLLERVEQRCPADVLKPPPCPTPCPSPCTSQHLECPDVPRCPDCNCPPPTVTVATSVPIMPRPVGQWYIGGGALLDDRTGLMAWGGYKFPRGVLLIAGPTWTDVDDIAAVTVTGEGTVNAPPGWIKNGKADPCKWSYTIPGRDARPWGVAIQVGLPVSRKGGSR